MDEIIMRRLRHLQKLEETHKADFEKRHGAEIPKADQQDGKLADVLSADWNRKRKAIQAPVQKRQLPHGWRKEHWKTQQSIAADYAGVDARNKKEAVEALEFYEAELTPPPAA